MSSKVYIGGVFQSGINENENLQIFYKLLSNLSNKQISFFQRTIDEALENYVGKWEEEEVMILKKGKEISIKTGSMSITLRFLHEVNQSLEDIDLLTWGAMVHLTESIDLFRDRLIANQKELADGSAS